MCLYKLFNILFFVKSFKYPDPSFQISNFVSFSSASTRSGSAVKLIHKHSRTSLAHHSYFHRLVRIWNSLPPIDLSLSFLTIKTQLIKILWCNFCLILIPPTLVLPCHLSSVHRFLSKSVLLNMVVKFFLGGVDRTCRHSISAASLSLTTQIHSYLTQLSAL